MIGDPGGARHPSAIMAAVPAPRPILGYALVSGAALLAAVNATFGKIVMESGGLSALRVSEVRATGAALLVVGGLALLRRPHLRPSARELPLLVAFGVVGVALAQFFYFSSIERVSIGVALLVVNLAIVLVALWSRFCGGELVHRRLWAAIVLSLAGLALVVQVWRGLAFSAVGLGAALLASVCYTAYILLADRGVRSGRSPSFLLGWAFIFAALFWAVVQPWWTFPDHLVANDVSLLGRLEGSTGPVWALFAYMVPLGTVAPFVLVTSAMRHLPPTHVVVANVLEPVFGALVAFAWLTERLGPVEIAGGILVLAGVALAQSARTSRLRTRLEAAPPRPQVEGTPAAVGERCA